MGVFGLFRGHHETRTALEVATGTDATHQPKRGRFDNSSLEQQNEKEIAEHPDRVTTDAGYGVQQAEAAALVWTQTAVWATYGWIWVCFFILALQSAIGSNVINYAYASFSTAPEMATANILGSVVGGVLKLPVAKVLNLWGRAEGFLVSLGVYLLGIVVIASCDGPNGYAAGYTLYWIGYYELYFIMDVFIADTSGLRNRAFAFAFSTTPFICTAFTGPLAAQSFLATGSWRWAYGAFAIIGFFAFTPLALVFKFYTLKANKMGLFVRTPSGRTTAQSVVHYAHEFDVVGAFLLMAAFILFLLPFSLQTNGLAGYGSATFIAMVVSGVVLFFVFAAWERWGARARFIKWRLLKNATVLGACLLAAVAFFSFYAWDQYFYSFCLVVYDLPISQAGYMVQIYNVGSCLWGVVFGLYVRRTRHFKHACLFFGLPLLMLGAGLMVHFRGSNQSIGYVIMCQVFIAVGGGTLVIGQDMAVMAASDRDGVPLMLALLGLSSSLGGAVGYAVAAAVYANTFPQALADALPEHLRAKATQIYLGGYTVQRTFPVGSAARDAIDYAWGYSQKWNCVSATASLVLGFPAILAWKNYNVDRRQNKGVLL